MHLMDLLSMILRCNGFAGFVRPAAEHQAVAVTLGEGEREGGREGRAHMHAHTLALRRIFGLTTEQIVINCYMHSAFFTHHKQNEKWLFTQNKRRENDCFHFRSA